MDTNTVRELTKSNNTNAIAVWASIAIIALGVVYTYAKFETWVSTFIENANEWHSTVAGELQDLRRNELRLVREDLTANISALEQQIVNLKLMEVKELAEELDGVQVDLSKLFERIAVIDDKLKTMEDKP